MMNREIQKKRRRRTHRNRPVKSTCPPSSEQLHRHLIEHFHLWTTSLRTTPTFEFDQDSQNKHRCKMFFTIFPHLQSVGNQGKSKEEAKANAITAFLAHLEKRRQVGLFVPHVNPALLRYIRTEIRTAMVPLPDMSLNQNEYLLHERIVVSSVATRIQPTLRMLERILSIRFIILWQSTPMNFFYAVGAKSQSDSIAPFIKALFEPELEQMFNYGENLVHIFRDDNFLLQVCQRLQIVCEHQENNTHLLIRGTSGNVARCYHEFVTLRKEFEAQLKCPTKENCQADSSLPIDTEKKSSALIPTTLSQISDGQPPCRSVVKDEETFKMTVTRSEEKRASSPLVIELSDDSNDNTDLQIVQTVTKKVSPPPRTIPQSNGTDTSICLAERFQLAPPPLFTSLTRPPNPIPTQYRPSLAPPQFRPPIPVIQPRAIVPPQPTTLRPIVLDGQNIARNSNDFKRTFSWLRLSNAINYFKNRGHQSIVAFLPLYFREFVEKTMSNEEIQREIRIRDTLIESQLIVFTPSRYQNGKRLTNYDDRFILQYAADNDGVVVSNDNFRDLEHETAFQYIIRHRILPFATVNNTFMPASDPLGRNGPNLDQFLCKSNTL